MRRGRGFGALAAAIVLAARVASALSGAVATEHPAAAAAGAAMLRAGGSAVDAAVAAAAAVCVVHASSCGVGGGGFALVWHAGSAHALDFRETAPAGARPAQYLVGGKPDPARSRSGGLAVGVPGEVAGWVALHERFGTLSLHTVLGPAIRLAREGFLLADTPHLRQQIERSAALLRADPGLAAIFLDHGEVPAPGFRIRQEDLARTLEAVGGAGRDAFYAAPMAERIAAAVQAHDGVLTAADVRGYLPVWRTPLEAAIAGRTVIAFPPPGSGGVLLTVLGILDDLPTEDGAGLRLLAAALARGFADRARWYGDPAFTTVPLATLLAPARWARLRAEMLAGAAAPEARPTARDAGTAHVSVLAADGDAVALTTTINTGFGAGVLVPGTGVILNNEMDDFVVAAGAENVYGLSGGAANLLGPGKRPQSSMSPTIVVQDGRPALAVGASGGPFIISATAEVLRHVVVEGDGVREAVAAPRLHDQGAGTPLLVEPGLAPRARAAVGERRVVELPAIGAAAAAVCAADGTFSAAGDPRKDGGAAVVP